MRPSTPTSARSRATRSRSRSISASPCSSARSGPFFMEGAGIFSLAGAGSGDNTLRTAVHTRRIIDPIFGAKVTGSAGRVTFGTLSAVDEARGETCRPTRRRPARIASSTSARAQYSLGPSNYVGALFTERPLRWHSQPCRRRRLQVAAQRDAAARSVCARLATRASQRRGRSDPAASAPR